jgi:rubrerythrin
MGILFDPSEVFKVAVRIEENGEKFYRTMSEKLQDPEVKKLFSLLAKDEVAHKKFYSEILSQIGEYNPHENYKGEYMAYLRSYADRIIFNQEVFDQNLNEINDVASAIDFAISAELKSIQYYHEIKELVPSKNHDRIDQIIEEERRHFIKLSEIEKRI